MFKPEICELYHLCAEIAFSLCNEIFMPLFLPDMLETVRYH